MGRGKLLDDPIGVAEGIDPHDDELADSAGDAAFDGVANGSIAEADLSEADETDSGQPSREDEPQDLDVTQPGADDISEDAPDNSRGQPLL
jgi:hypothetical protein